MAQVAIGVAASLALSLVTSFLFRPKGQDVEGQRKTDFGAGPSAYGRGIQLHYGTVPVEGNIIWMDEVKAVKRTRKVGSKKTGRSKIVEWEYFGTFAVSLGAPASVVRRVWGNNKLLVDYSDHGETGASSPKGSVYKYGREHYAIHLGGEDQKPDPTIEAVEGAGNVPAYKDHCYIVFRDLPLKDFGNSLPQIKAEVVGGNVQPNSFTEMSVATFADTAGDDYRTDPSRPLMYMRADAFYKLDVFTGRVKKRFSFATDPLVAAIAQDDFSFGPGSVFDWAIDPATGDLLISSTSNSRMWFWRFDNDFNLIGVVFFGVEGTIKRIKPLGERYAVRIGVGGGDPAGIIYRYHPSLYPTTDTSPSGAGNWALLVSVGSTGTYQDYALNLDDNIGYLCVAPLTIFKFDGPDRQITSVDITADSEFQGSNNFRLMTFDAPSQRLIVFTDHYVFALNKGTLAIEQRAYHGLDLNVPDANLKENAYLVRGSVFVTAGAAHTGDLKLYEFRCADLALARTINLYDNWSDNFGFSQWFYSYYTNSLVTIHTASTPTVGDLNPFHLWVNRYSQVSTTLDLIVSDLCQKAGLDTDNLDVSDLSSQTVRGYRVVGQSTGREALEPLRRVFHFDGVERGSQLIFVRRRAASLQATIPETHLAARIGGSGEREAELIEPRTQEVELPLMVEVTYLDAGNDYNSAVQTAKRSPDATRSVNRVRLEHQLVLSRDEGMEAAWRLLEEAWIERDAKEFSLPPRWLALEPTDVVRIPKATGLSGNFDVRIAEIDLGAAYTLRIKGVLHRAAAFDQDNRTGAETETPVEEFIPFDALSRAVLLNGPAFGVQDDDGGAWGGLLPDGDFELQAWNGAVLYASPDELNYEQVGVSEDAATRVVAVTALPTFDRWTVLDRTNTLTVRVSGGATLETITEQQLLAGQNLILFSTGEVVGFATAEEQDQEGTWKLSTLWRGAYGTEWAVDKHVIGEEGLIIDRDTVARFSDLDFKDQERTYKAVTIGGLVSEASTQTFTNESRALKPWAPTYIQATYSGGTFTITWERRVRYSGALIDGVDVPVIDGLEFEIDILDADGDAVRTLSVENAQTVDYDDYDTDFSTAASFTSLLANAGFETGDLTGWTVDPDFPGAAVETNSGGMTAIEGTYFVFAQAGESRLYQVVSLSSLNISPGKVQAGDITYDMNWWRARSDPADQGQIILEFLDGDGVQFDSVESPIDLDTEDVWFEESLTGMVPEGTASIRVVIHWVRQQGVAANMLFDDLSLTLNDGNNSVRRALVKVYHMSDSVGRGYGRQARVDQT